LAVLKNCKHINKNQVINDAGILTQQFQCFPQNQIRSQHITRISPNTIFYKIKTNWQTTKIHIHNLKAETKKFVAEQIRTALIQVDS